MQIAIFALKRKIMPAMMSTEAMRKRNHKISANRRYVMKVVLERYHGLEMIMLYLIQIKMSWN